MKQCGISIITPPGVSLLILKEGYNLGCRHFLLQPGTHDATTEEYINSGKMDGANVVKGCVLVELGFSEH